MSEGAAHQSPPESKDPVFVHIAEHAPGCSRTEYGGIVNDPNRTDDEQYILRLIGQVITVSLEP